MNEYLKGLKPAMRKAVIERCGTEDVTADGIQCTQCGALEVYKDAKDPKNMDKWAWIIRAFRIDNASECRNCKQWFAL
jgi:hypothetical protein